jgi:V-type H+-transporting ATPase subunit d
MLDKIMYEEEVRQLMATYEQQFHYAVFYSYMRLRWGTGAWRWKGGGGGGARSLPLGDAAPACLLPAIQPLTRCLRCRPRVSGPPCREQEIRNILWIAECVAQDQKNRVQDGIVFTY